MPEYVFVEESTGRELSLFGDTPPDQATVEGAFRNYDALKVASSGPKGSEERRRAMAQEVAAQQEASTEDSASQRGRLPSAGQSFMRGGGVGSGQSVSDLVRTLETVQNPANVEFGVPGNSDFAEAVAAERGIQPIRQRTALEREQLVQENPIYQAGQSLSAGAKLAYQPNPKFKGEFFTDVIPSSAGAMVPTIAASLVAGPAAGAAQYGLASGQQAAEEAIASGRPETAQTASIATLPIGALSEFGLGAAANVGKLAKLGAQRGALVAAGRAAAGEGIQEGVEQVGGNLIASDVAGYDPNRPLGEGVAQAMAAGALLGGVIGGASAKIAQANTTPDLLAGLSEKWKAITLARELNAAMPAAQPQAAQPIVQQFSPELAQLSLAGQNAPPQFQLITSEAPQAQQPAPYLSDAAAQLARLEQSRQSAQPSGGAAIPQEQSQPILPQGDLMERLREARRTDEMRQPSQLAAGRLGTGQPVGAPPALNPMSDWLQIYEESQRQNQVQAPGPLPNEQSIPAQPAPEAEAPQGNKNRQGPLARGVGRRVNLRAPKPKTTVKPSQTITGSNEEAASEMPVLPTGGEAALSRSEPAAAQGVATEGAGISSGEVPAFSGRRYGKAPFIDLATYNEVRGKVDEGLASGDDVAKRIAYFEKNAETALGTAAGYAALTPEGQQSAVNGFKRKLYQSAKRWVDGGEFKFAAQPIARSIASDVGKSNAEKMRKATVSGESTEEGGEEIRGKFESISQPVLPQIPLKAPVKVQDETILSLKRLQEQLGATTSQLQNIIMASVNPDLEANLDDAEMAMLERSRTMLERLEKINYSLSSLIREPIGLARAQNAVARWKMETGVGDNVDIQVVEDTNLTTPDGRPVAALVRLRPGLPPSITINAAQIASEDEVVEKLWHEALHPVWGDGEVQKAWSEVINALPASAVQAELARGYSPLEATMEAVINLASTKAANTKVRSAWQRFLDAVWEAMGRVFGFETKPKDFERLMESALRSLSRPYNQPAKTQYADQMTQQDAEYLAAVQRGDMETAQRMVDEAAKAAGYNVGPVWHGTKGKFNTFELNDDRARDSGWLGRGFYFTLNGKEFAESFGPNTISAYLKATNIFDVRTATVADLVSLVNASRKANGLGPLAAEKEIELRINWRDSATKDDWIQFDGPRPIKRETLFKEYGDTLAMAKAAGYDAVRGAAEGAVVVSSPSQIKSADPVTYDDAGNPIPLSRRFQQESPDIRYSVANSFALTKTADAALKSLETSSDPQSILAMGKAASSLVSPELTELLQSVQDAKPGTPEATLRTYLKQVNELAGIAPALVEWASANGVPIPAFQSINDLDPQWRAVVGNAMMGSHFELGTQARSIDQQIEKAAEKLAEVADDFADASEKRLVGEAAKNEAKNLLDNLLSLIEVERSKLGTSSETLSAQEADNAALAVSQIRRGKLDVLSNGLETIAREMPIAGFLNNEAALAWLKERQSKNPIFGQDAQDAYNALEKALQRQPDLTKRIDQIRALTLDGVDGAREVKRLAGELGGKNKANVIKNYAKLRAESDAAFLRFRQVSKRFDRLTAHMDGLVRAKEELRKLMESPDYRSKLGEVFDGAGRLSGLMAQVVDRGLPTGVVEIYGPSAYKAAGGKVARGDELKKLRSGKAQQIGTYGEAGFNKANGLIYKIDWNPEFAIEKKNIEAIDALAMELIDALNNPESPNYITDPLARSSYNSILSSISRFMGDRRYLVEQQYADSILLKMLRPLGVFGGASGLLSTLMPYSYTTRMNAAVALGGRAGRQFEEANKAVDGFEKRAENTLRDTATENAEARRASVESHGLNPNNPYDIQKWSAHISSVLGSMQNPSQDQLKEGDYVGSLKVTKEDLRSARIQKEFSTKVVKDFSNMGSTIFETVNPEEEIGGVLFTRAAEDYGMKTRREFSKWGEEFSRKWDEATKADMDLFRQKQAEATGEVEMVWENREKLANENIEGPVWSHISETNSEYQSKASSLLKTAFKRLRKDLKAGRSDGLMTMEDIGKAISELTVNSEGVAELNPIEAKIEMVKAIEKDVEAYKRAASEYAESGLGTSDLPDAIMSVKAASGALAKARGKMVAPTWFYDYGIHNDQSRAMEIAQGKRILLMKVYETMGAYREALKRNLDDAKREIDLAAQKLGRNGEPVGKFQAEKEYDRKQAAKYKEGGIFATRKMMEKADGLLETMTKELKDHLAASSGVASDQIMARAGRSLFGTFASTLLAQPTSIINNLTAVTLDPYRTQSMSNRLWLKLWGPTRGFGRMAKYIATDLVRSLPAGLRRSLSKARKIALIDMAGSVMDSAVKEKLLLEEAGLVPTFESLGSIYRRVKSNPLSFGRTTPMESGKTEQGLSSLMAKIPWAVAFGTWVKERTPGYYDGVINRVIAADSQDFVQWLTPHLWEWAKSLPGTTAEEKAFAAERNGIIAPEDIGVTAEGLAQIRDFLSGLGSLESIAARMVLENGTDSIKNKLPFTNDELNIVKRDAGRKYNTRASSTSPDFIKTTSSDAKGILKSSLHVFMSWVLQRMGADANQFFKVKGGGAKKEWGVVYQAIMLLVATLLAGSLAKMPKDAWRWITGNPATTPNIFQAISDPEMAARYLATSAAGVMYAGGDIAGELLGGTGISSPLNNNLLDNNPFAGFVASMLSTAQRAYQTQDLKYPLADFARRNFWPAGAILNYAMPGDVEARGATRAVRMGSSGLEVRPTGGGVGARETPTTPMVRDAVAALYEGNTANFNRARDRFVEYQIGQGRTEKEALKRFESSVGGRDPLRSVLGRNPTTEEESTIIGRLSQGQRRTVDKARSLFRKPKKVRLGGARRGRKLSLGRRRPARRTLRLRRLGA